jgi:LacI family transcriptional regulator, galactose operon repressor
MELRMRVGIAEVATKAGVSPATASRALNGKRGVKPATRTRVLDAAANLRYTASAAGRGLVTARTATIGYVVHHRRPPEEVYPFYGVIMHAIEAELSRHGHHLMITTVVDDQFNDAAALPMLAENRVDGVVLIGPDFPDQFLIQLQHLGRPVLLVDNTLGAVPIDTIRIDDRQGGRSAAEHLIGHGHRQIAALLGPADWPSSADRGAGYREAMSAAGLTPHVIHGAETTPEAGEALFRRALSEMPALSAVFTANDAMAFGVLAAATGLGRRVPDDLAVIGFDDVATSTYVQPPLTTVRVFKRELGKLAARRMLELVSDTDRPPVQTLVATELVVRRSCGCAPPRD